MCMQHLLHSYTLGLVAGQVPLKLLVRVDMSPENGLAMHVESRHRKQLVK